MNRFKPLYAQMCQVITKIQLLTYPYSYPRVTHDPHHGSWVSWDKGKGRAGVTLGLPVTYTSSDTLCFFFVLRDG